MPVRPDYFLEDAEINREGAAPLSQMQELAPINPQELKSLLAEGVIALDVARQRLCGSSRPRFD